VLDSRWPVHFYIMLYYFKSHVGQAQLTYFTQCRFSSIQAYVQHWHEHLCVWVFYFEHNCRTAKKSAWVWLYVVKF